MKTHLMRPRVRSLLKCCGCNHYHYGHKDPRQQISHQDLLTFRMSYDTELDLPIGPICLHPTVQRVSDCVQFNLVLVIPASRKPFGIKHAILIVGPLSSACICTAGLVW